MMLGGEDTDRAFPFPGPAVRRATGHGTALSILCEHRGAGAGGGFGPRVLDVSLSLCT